MDTTPNPSSAKKDVLHIGGQPAFFRTTTGQQQQSPQLHHHQYQPRASTPPVATPAPAAAPTIQSSVTINEPTAPAPLANNTPSNWSATTSAPPAAPSTGLKLPNRPANPPSDASSLFTSYDSKQDESSPLFKTLGRKETPAEADQKKQPPAKAPVKTVATERDNGTSILGYVAIGIVVLFMVVGGVWGYVQFNYVNQRSIQANKKIDDQIKATDGIRTRLTTTQNELALLNEKFNQSVARQTELFEKQIEIALDQSIQKKALSELQDQFRQQSDLLRSQMDIIKQQPNLQKRLVEINNQIAQRQIILEKQVQTMSNSINGSASFSSSVINPANSATSQIPSGAPPVIKQ